MIFSKHFILKYPKLLEKVPLFPHIILALDIGLLLISMILLLIEIFCENKLRFKTKNSIMNCFIFPPLVLPRSG